MTMFLVLGGIKSIFVFLYLSYNRKNQKKRGDNMNKISKILISFLLGFSCLFSVMPIYGKEKETEIFINDSNVGDKINQIQYVGTWSFDENYPDLFYGGDDHWISPLDNGNSFDNTAIEIVFYGNAIELYGNLEPMAGIQQVYIDQFLIAEVDTYKSSKELGACLFNSKEHTTLSEGKHVLRYVPSGKKNENSSSYNMQFDYAKVYAKSGGQLQYAQFDQNVYQMNVGEKEKIMPQLFPSEAAADMSWKSSNPTIASIDQNGMIHAKKEGECVISLVIESLDIDISFILEVHEHEVELIETIVNDDQVGTDVFQFSFDGPWVHEGGYPDRFEGGDEHWITKSQFGENYPSFTFRFIGTKVELYGHKISEGPIADVYVDGEKVDTIDYYLPSRQEKQLLFESKELEEKEHTVCVKLNGERNPAAGMNYEAAIDYAKVYHSDREFYPTEIHLNKDEIVLEEGLTYQPEYQILPSYATIIPEIIWYSEDEDIASVNHKNGEIIAHKEGKTRIHARLEGMEVEAQLQVEVKKCKETFSAMVSDNNLHTYPNQYFDYLEQMYDNGTLKLRSWSDSAWLNDEVTSRIDIFTKSEEYEEVELVVHDFVSEKGNVLGSENITMSFMENPVAHTNKQNIMDVITNKKIMDLKKQSVYGVWVNIAIPKNVVPDVYKGVLEIQCDGRLLASFDYSIDVLNFMQPEDNETSQLELWMYPYSSNRYYSKKTSEEYFKDSKNLYYVYLDDHYLKGLESQLELYHDAGGDAITVTVVEDPWNSQTPDPYPSMVKWKRKVDGTFDFDYTDLDKWVKLNMQHGIDKQIKSFSMSCWGNRITYYDEISQDVVSEMPATGSQRWKELWGYFLEDYIQHMDTMGWFDITYMAMDERPLSEIVPVLDLIDSYTNKDGKTMKTSLAVFNYETESIFDRIDDLSLAYQMGSSKVNEMANSRKAKGLMTTMYTCGAQNSAMLNQPGESAYSIYHAYKYGTDGFLRWAFDSFNEDPLVSSDHDLFASGDIYLIYPSDKNDESMQAQTTPRFEKLEEGIRDVAKLRYLSETYPEYREEIKVLISSLGKGNMCSEVKRMRSEIFRISREIMFGKIEPKILIPEGNQIMEVGDVSQLSLTSEPENLLDELLKKGSKINDFDKDIHYFGKWNTDEGYPDLFFNGDDHWCAPNTNEDMKNYGYEFEFYGDMFSIVGNKENLGGIVDIYIDGEFVASADQYSSGTSRFEKIYTSQLLELGSHHVKVVGSGKRNMNSEAYNMQLDYIETYVHQKPIWTSSDADIVSISEDGVIKALKAGSATISVLIQDYSASINVSVTNNLEIVDKGDLKSLIQYAKSLNQNDYTYDSWNKLKETIIYAEKIMKDDTASESEVQEAINRLSKAIENLDRIDVNDSHKDSVDTRDSTNMQLWIFGLLVCGNAIMLWLWHKKCEMKK